MNVDGKPYQSIWPDPSDPEQVRYIDQNKLPFEFRITGLKSSEDAISAIRSMRVRGAPLIGVTGAFGVYMASLEAKNKAGSAKIQEKYLIERAELIRNARPTAVNLAWAVDRMLAKISSVEDLQERTWTALEEAVAIMEEEKDASLKIGQHGMGLIKRIHEQKGGEPVNILTHCNAGWLACIDYGTATAPVYLAHDQKIPVHVWVDETRPRNQGSRLTAWELGQHGVPHTVVVDNAGGHLMQKGLVDMVIVGSDRTTRTGDVANKIGTYLKALAAFDNKIPFYVALPSSSIDFSIRSGLEEIEIEERDTEEVNQIEGSFRGRPTKVKLLPEGSPASNYGFDITPAKYVSGLITERGICAANEEEIKRIFPDY